jgi:cellulose synthase operon protein C
LNALKVDKSFPDAHYALAQAYVHLGQFSERMPNWRTHRGLAADKLQGANRPWQPAACRRQDRRRAKAGRCRVMAAQPNNPDVHAMLSAIARQAGQKDQALIEIHRALELDPNRAAFHEDLALLQVGRSEPRLLPLWKMS